MFSFCKILNSEYLCKYHLSQELGCSQAPTAHSEPVPGHRCFSLSDLHCNHLSAFFDSFPADQVV